MTKQRTPTLASLLFALSALACGGAPRSSSGSGAGSAEATPPAADRRTAIDQRRDAACEALGPKLTACAVEDARADFAAGKISKQQLDSDIAVGVQRKHTEEFLKACKGSAYSSRQIRVLEVCGHDERQCGPLVSCLGHLSDAPTAP